MRSDLQINEVATTLRKRYKDYNHNNKRNPLNELLFIMCSTKTTDPSYERTYNRFRSRYKTFDGIAKATTEEIAISLSTGGLQNIKARYIKSIMKDLNRIFGSPTLAPLKRFDDKSCEAFLTSLPGVGLKVARCVMMYSLDRKVFPVDTHCWRITKRLGWIRSTISNMYKENDINRLQEKIPSLLRFSLHVNFVSLGRDICKFNDPKCHMCPIEGLCKKVGVKNKI